MVEKYKGQTIKMDIINSGTNWRIEIGNINEQYNSNEPQPQNMTLSIPIPSELNNDLYVNGTNVTVTRIYIE